MTATATYQALLNGYGIVDRSDRGRLAVSGPDRAKYLHNVTTNDVKKLAVGQGHEAFVTSLQGKTLGFVTLLAEESRILLRTDPNALAAFLPHLRKYGVFDEVEIDDISGETYELHVLGSGAESALIHAGIEVPPVGEGSHVAATIGDARILVVRESPTRLPGFTLIGPAAEASALISKLRDAGEGLVEVFDDVFEGLRIEAGTPLFGKDLTADNLPQELGRDSRAISFVKGCYLGQETVARIDALGHVNKNLKGLRFVDTQEPAPAGSEIQIDGKKVGTITSSTVSPSTGWPIALGYVRATHALEGTEVSVVSPSGNVAAVVLDLPMKLAENA